MLMVPLRFRPKVGPNKISIECCKQSGSISNSLPVEQVFGNKSPSLPSNAKTNLNSLTDLLVSITVFKLSFYRQWQLERGSSIPSLAIVLIDRSKYCNLHCLKS